MTSENAENPVRPDKSEPDASGKADVQSGDSKNNVPPTTGQPQTAPSPCHCEMTCKTKRDWIDIAALCLEGLGLFILVVYAAATIAIWCANKQSADAATKAARAAVENISLIRSTSNLDQRAWIGVEGISGTPPSPETNKPFDVNILFRNSGKTPAVNEFLFGDALPGRSLPNVWSMCERATKEGTRNMMAPNATLTLQLHPSNGKPLRIGWEEDLRKKGSLYVFGCAIYNDIFVGQRDWEGHHWLLYCGVLNVATKQFDTCKQYNDTGDGKPPTQ